MVQNDKKLCLLHSICQEPYIMWLSFIVQMCKIKIVISPSVFFNFKILIFQVVSGLKGQKMAQNDKNFCLLHLIFQEPYIIWSSFMVHMMYKRIISPGIVFIFFSKFRFSGSLGVGKRAKKWPKMTKYSVCLTLYLRNRTSYDYDFR